MCRHDLAHLTDAIGTGDLEIGVIPQHQMPVVGVIAIDIAPLAGALADPPETDLAQSPDLAHHAGAGEGIEQIDLLAVAGLAQQFTGRQFLTQRLALLRMADGLLGHEQTALAAPDAIQVLAQQARLGVGIEGIAVEALQRNQLADAQLELPLALAKHLMRQQGRAEAAVDRRQRIEERRVAPADMDRQHRRVGLAREMQEARQPLAIARPGRACTRDLAGREDDHGLFIHQRIADLTTALAIATTTEVVQRQQQGCQRLDLHQDVIGDDLDVAAHFADQLEQCEAIQ